ncbi:hypothetical protein ABBQ38_007736 [Trebouxia sp. C0009 RCD-2024]
MVGRLPLDFEVAVTLHYVTVPDKARFTLLESMTPSINGHCTTAIDTLMVAHYLLSLAAASRDNCMCTSQFVGYSITPTCRISSGRSECMTACAPADAQTAYVGQHQNWSTSRQLDMSAGSHLL